MTERTDLPIKVYVQFVREDRALIGSAATAEGAEDVAYRWLVAHHLSGGIHWRDGNVVAYAERD